MVQVMAAILFWDSRLRHLFHLLFPNPLLGPHGLCFPGGLPSHTIKPVGNHLSGNNRSCPADKDQEGSLKSVLRIVIIAQDPAANIPHQRAMPAHESCKRSFIAL